MKRTIAGTATLAVLTAVAAAQAAAQQSEEFRWSGRLEPGQVLEVRGLNGEIRAERATGPDVEVVAVKTARRSDPASVTIEVIPHPGGVTICSLYPAPPNRPANECAPGESRMNVRNNDVNVAYMVRVPDGVRLLARTTNGIVDVNGLTADVDVSTTNGGIRIVTQGVARARTTNGDIDVTMGSTGTGDLEFRTTNGDVTVTLPADLNAEFSAATTNGNFSSDFPVMVQGSFGPRRMEGRIGNGGRQLELGTTNGDIRLRRSGG
jgi:hypothetical protein